MEENVDSFGAHIYYYYGGDNDIIHGIIEDNDKFDYKLFEKDLGKLKKIIENKLNKFSKSEVKE